MSAKILGLLAAGLLVGPTAARAITVDDISYTLSQSLVSSTPASETWSVTLEILNNSSDGRTGVTALAFTRPVGFVAASLSGWTTMSGGLNASGCNGSGNFLCFSGYAAAAEAMSFTFALTAGHGASVPWMPGFKIDWVGSKSNYDLVSQRFSASVVPEPGTLILLVVGLGGLAMRRRRRDFSSGSIIRTRGNLKISINGGAYTLVPSSAYRFNAYNTTLQSAAAGNTNPLAGQPAFSGTDGGSLFGSWGQSQINLTTLGVKPNDTIRLRYDFGTDGCNGNDGWYVDDIRVSACNAKK